MLYTGYNFESKIHELKIKDLKNACEVNNEKNPCKFHKSNHFVQLYIMKKYLELN